MTDEKHEPPPRVHLSKVKFESGLELELKPDTLLMLIGPNNSGKSRSLRDMHLLIKQLSDKGVKSVVKVEIEKSGTSAGIEALMKQRAHVRDNAVHFITGEAFNPASNAPAIFDHGNGLGILTSLFAILLNAEARIAATKPAPLIDLTRDAPRVPIHYLQKHEEDEAQVRELFERLFRTEIALNRNNGSNVPIHVGSRPPELIGQELGLQYAKEVAKLPFISEQGDGMIASLGLLLYIAAVPREIYFVDEPDVYLHPPQAFSAAKILAEQTVGKQLIIATHSSHFLRGALAAAPERVLLVRLDRSSGAQEARRVDVQAFSAANAEPIVKFTPILDAAFYSSVVVCEDEADCLFYRAMLAALGLLTDDSPVFWLSAHGKQNIKKIVAVLKSLGVRTRSIADFDVLNDEQVLRPLVEAHGANWSDMAQNYKVLKTAVEGKKPTLAANDVKKEMQAAIDKVSDSDGTLFPESTVKEIKEIFKRSSPWHALKISGLSGVPKGPPTVAAKRILADLRNIGIHVPVVGQMESFYKALDTHGVQWVTEVLKMDLKNNVDLESARQFVRSLNETIVDMATQAESSTDSSAT